MTPEARALGQALLNHHRASCREVKIPAEKMDNAVVHSQCISYENLCERAHNPCTPRLAGKFLTEIAIWCCEEHDWPPIHALVVNRKSKIPGPGYETAPSGGFGQWEGQVRKCIAFRGYPDKMPKD
jgi:hypothetical protein